MSVRFPRRWFVLAFLGLLVGGLVGFVVVRILPPTYQATVTLVVQPGAGVQDVQIAQVLAQSYAEALHTRRVLSDAAQQVGLSGLSERDLEARVTARQVTGTQLLRVSVDDTDPTRAANFANAVAQVFIKTNADIQASGYAGSLDNLSRLVGELQADVD
jgi:capsular polysaccharide biosynthesis protein